MRDIYLNTSLFADDMVVFSESEDDLQLGLFKFYETLLTFNCRASTTKTKLSAFKGK